MNLSNLTIKKIQQGLKEKVFSVKELTQVYLNHINDKDKEIDAFLSIRKEKALEEAQAVDEYLNSGGDMHPLTGVPIAIKDNMLISDEITTSASKILENYKATYSSTVVQKLKEQRAIILGKTNLDEFAMGASTENSAFKVTKNPYDLTRVPGGSSGGSTASVAADMSPIALGSDTGGSIRLPAHFCGVIGLKPTYGAVSRYGLMAMSSSLDQIGPITRTVEDSAILFKAIAGKDQFDNTSVNADYSGELIKGCKDLTIGIPKEYFSEGSEPEVKLAVEKVIEFYRNQGFKTKEVSLPNTKYGLTSYYIIQPAEVSSNLARYDGIRYSDILGGNREQYDLEEIYLNSRTKGFGSEVKRRIILGTFVLSSGYYDAYYKKAWEVRDYIIDDFDSVFKEVDVLLTPTGTTKAFKIGEKSEDPLAMYMADILTVPASLAGIPAISVPIKVPKGELPIGFQLMGKKWHESDLLSLAHVYEQGS